MPVWLDRMLGRANGHLHEGGLLGDYPGELLELDFSSEFGTPYVRSDAGSLDRPQQAVTYPTEWSITERRAQLLRAHQAWERNPLAKQGVGLIRRFVVGQGLQISYSSPVVEEVLEAWRWLHRQHLERWEKQWFDQLLIDGELVLRVYANGLQGENADVRVLSVKPWLVEAIETEPEDRTALVRYWLVPEVGSGSPSDPLRVTGAPMPVDPREIVHCSINALSYEMRGRSELYAILPWLTAYKDWLENRARINRYLGVLYHLQAEGAGPAQIAAIRSRFRKPLEPQSVLVTSARETLNKLDQSTGARDAGEDGRMIRLMAIVGMGLPEYMLADGQNANLATTKSQQLPALRSFQDYQDIYAGQVWRPVYEHVLAAVLGPDAMVPEVDNDGALTGKQIRACDAFALAGADLVEDDPKTLAEALAIHVANGWASSRTASTRAGYDWQQEQEYIKAEGVEQPPSYGAPPEDEPDDVEAPA